MVFTEISFVFICFRPSAFFYLMPNLILQLLKEHCMEIFLEFLILYLMD